MRPELVMLEVRPLDARKQQVGTPFKFPHIELDKLVFLRVPEKKLKQMKRDGSMESFTKSLTQAAGATGLAWITTAEITSMIDGMIESIRDGEQTEFHKSDLEFKLSELRSGVASLARPTNKTFIILDESVRFLEVKEKWEKMPDEKLRQLPKGDS